MNGVPYQFLGYWGYEPTLAERLSQVVTSRFTVKRFSQSSISDSKDCSWGVAYIGPSDCIEVSKHDAAMGIIASISAAGLPAPDAWVKVEKCLILGREPFGRVPLYWTQLGQTIWFASRLQLLLPLIETPQISIPGLYGYSCFSYVPTPLSPVADIFAVPAGTTQTFYSTSLPARTPALTLHRLHEWQQAPVLLTDEGEAIAQLQTLLRDAIHRQTQDLRSEPVGVYLSGGIDSSTVAALLVQAGIKVRAYALDFEPVLSNNSSELPYAQEVAEFLNIPLVKVEVTPQAIRQAIAATAQAPGFTLW